MTALTTPLPVLRETMHALTRTIGDLDHGTIIEPITRTGLIDPHGGAVYVVDAIGRGAYVVPADVVLVTGPVVIVEHVAGWTTALGHGEPLSDVERMAAALDIARPVLPAVAGVRAVEVIRQH